MTGGEISTHTMNQREQGGYFANHTRLTESTEPGDNPFKFMMEIDRLAADLHRLGDTSITKVRKWRDFLAGLSADYKKECRMLENDPTDL